MKNTLKRTNNRLKGTEKWISNLQSGTQGNRKYPSRTGKKRILNNENKLRNLWNNTKHSNIHIIGVLKEERQAKKTYLNK